MTAQEEVLEFAFCGSHRDLIYYIGGSRGGRAGRTPPLRDPILSFSHTFSPKSTRVGGPRLPLMGPRPPMENPGSANVLHKCEQQTI